MADKENTRRGGIQVRHDDFSPVHCIVCSRPASAFLGLDEKAKVDREDSKQLMAWRGPKQEIDVIRFEAIPDDHYL